MKSCITILLLLSTLCIFADAQPAPAPNGFSQLFQIQNDFNPDTVAAPLLPLSQQLPVSIDYSNRLKYLQNPSLLDPEAQRNITAIHSKTFPWHIILATIGLIFAIVLFKTFPPPPKEAKPQQQIPPHIKALKEINDLAKSQLLEKKLYSPFVTHLDQIVRNYIEDHYQINAPTLTSSEFLQAATTSSFLDSPSRQMLIHFLQQTDKVKFAKHDPSPAECMAVLAAAQQLIKS